MKTQIYKCPSQCTNQSTPVRPSVLQGFEKRTNGGIVIVFVCDGVSNYATDSGSTLSVLQGFEKRTNGNWQGRKFCLEILEEENSWILQGCMIAIIA